MNVHIAKAIEFKQRFEKLLTGKWAYRLQEIRGFSQENISAIELKYKISLPQGYRVFLSEFGNTYKSFLLDLDMGDEHPLEMTEFFYAAINTPEQNYVPPINVPSNIFVFASYLYEHFYFFFINNPFDNPDDPSVYLANVDQDGGQPFQFEKVGESVWEFLEESISKYENGKKEGKYFVE